MTDNLVINSAPIKLEKITPAELVFKAVIKAECKALKGHEQIKAWRVFS